MLGIQRLDVEIKQGNKQINERIDATDMRAHALEGTVE